VFEHIAILPIMLSYCYNKPMRIYLIRHGQTTGDIEDRFGGDYEDHLTQEGESQSKQLAEKLVNKNIEIIYCSPRIRAQETARILKETINAPIEVIDDIRERNHYGVMTGMVKAEAKEKFPQLIELLKDTKNTIEGGEDYESFKERVVASWNRLTTSNHKTIAILSHGGPIRLIFRELLNKGEIKIGDCAFATIEGISDELSIVDMDGIEIV
jgi:broad specificity phosphatase PhoE